MMTISNEITDMIQQASNESSISNSLIIIIYTPCIELTPYRSPLPSPFSLCLLVLGFSKNAPIFWSLPIYFDCNQFKFNIALIFRQESKGILPLLRPVCALNVKVIPFLLSISLFALYPYMICIIEMSCIANVLIRLVYNEKKCKVLLLMNFLTYISLIKYYFFPSFVCRILKMLKVNTTSSAND